MKRSDIFFYTSIALACVGLFIAGVGYGYDMKSRELPPERWESEVKFIPGSKPGVRHIVGEA